MTLVAPDRLTGWLCRCVVVTAVTVAVAGVLPAPALALPKWHITMTHANPYGVQASECPGGKPDPKVPCGINPLTEADGEEGAGGNGETFARESGFNTYKITVENAGDEGTNEEEEVTVVDLLPKGLVLAGEPQAMVSGQGWAGPGGNGNCKVLAGGVG